MANKLEVLKLGGTRLKKAIKIIALVMAFVMLFALTGCGAKSKIKGEWEATYNGAKVTLNIDKKVIEATYVSEDKTVNETIEYEINRKYIIVEGDEMKYSFIEKDKFVLTVDNVGDLEFTRK